MNIKPTKELAKQIADLLNGTINTKTYCRIANPKSSIRNCFQLFPEKINGIRPEYSDKEKMMIINALIPMNSIDCSRNHYQLSDYQKYWNGSSLTFIIRTKPMPQQRLMYVAK